MKKFVIAVLFLAPFTLNAQTAAGIEFQTPLVQNIVNLLHERIAELQEQTGFTELKERISFLEARNAQLNDQIHRLREEAATCAPTGGVSAEDAERASLKNKIADKRAKIVSMKQEFEKRKDEIERTYSGASAGEAKLIAGEKRELDEKINDIRLEIEALEIELSRL